MNVIFLDTIKVGYWLYYYYCLSTGTSEGLTLQAIDEHSVVLGILHLDASFFKFYSCDRPVSLSIDLYHFNKAVEYATAKDHALMEISEEEKVLSISFQKPNGRTKARFDLNASQSKFKKFILDVGEIHVGLTQYCFIRKD